MTTQPLPWFAHPKNQPGQFLVTWWVPVRTRRGSVKLDPRSLRFATEGEAREAAANKAHARDVWIMAGRERIA